MRYLGLLMVDIALSIYLGFALMNIWEWYITPFGLQSISVAHAFGISLVFHIATPISSTDDDVSRVIAIKATRITLCLMFGFIASNFI